MSKSALLITATIVALFAATGSFAGGPSSFAPTGNRDMAVASTVHGAKTLYSQNSDDAGTAVLSQNFTSGSYVSANAQGADDFVVPQGAHWNIGEIDVTGAYFNGSGPAKSVNIFFYRNSNILPEKRIRSFKNLQCDERSGSFVCKLPDKVRLAAGHYWLSVQANCSLAGGCGEWGWELRSIISNDQAAWQNPCEGCFLCPHWQELDQCLGYNNDFMFALKT